MPEIKTGILGGGLAGLSLRYFLRGTAEVLEKEAECGGLCRSIKENGFVFDQGGHILFSKKQELLDIILKVLGDNVERRRRNNKICYNGRFVKYPFE
ncbi:MAG: NAD(P)-binding protein, partial [Candidatus Omnitrophica bacterium]|nr:NAD(P)-binding protein [Candidatus Omnitrophota bacterium]